MLSSHDLPPPPLDKCRSDRGLDHQSAVIDVTGNNDGVAVRTPSHSLPAVGFASLQSAETTSHLGGQKQSSSAVVAHGNVMMMQDQLGSLAKNSGDGSRHGLRAVSDGGHDGAAGFLDVDDDCAMHVDRDPNHWHDIVRIKFDDIFGEPDPEVFSADNIWSTTNKVFTLSKYWCYRVISMALAVPMAAIWGVYFACMVFCRVWCCIPCLKACEIEMQCVRRFNETLMRSLTAPFYEAIGRCFYHIRIRVLKTTEDNP